MISLWPGTPLAASGDTPQQIKNLVFPSGRQCVTHALNIMGGQRKWLTAIPEYSSHCLISSVAKKTTPLPISVATAHPELIRTVIIYCQWGWEKPQKSLREVQSHFADAKLIMDMVDSVHSTLDGLVLDETDETVFQVFSLSKTLGLGGGGIIFGGHTWITNEYAPIDEEIKITNKLYSIYKQRSEITQILTKTWLLADMPLLSPGLNEWLEENDLCTALALATKARKAHSEVVLRFIGQLGWEPWMVQQIETTEGRLPGILPLFLDGHKDVAKLKNEIETEVGVELALYHFNRSESYCASDWVPCLAVPLHWQLNVEKVETVIQMWLHFIQKA